MQYAIVATQESEGRETETSDVYLNDEQMRREIRDQRPETRDQETSLRVALSIPPKSVFMMYKC
jgi:hypothetical protein